MKNLAYNLLSAFYPRGKKLTISGVQIRLPFRYSRYYPADYEAEHVRFFKQHIQQGQVVFDIGAQLGLMSKAFFDLTGSEGKVYAFEPTPATYDLLCQTIRLNQMGSVVTPIKQAVSDKRGKTHFYISDMPLDPANSLVNYDRQHSAREIEVELVSIDDFLSERQLQKVDFIKIDAEGAEYRVLLGATKTLQKFKPVIHLALHPDALKNFDSTLQQIVTFISNHNYTILYKGKIMNLTDFTSMTGLFDVELLPHQKN